MRRRRLSLFLLALIVLVLAIGGWAVDGARWALGGRALGGRRPRPAPA